VGARRRWPAIAAAVVGLLLALTAVPAAADDGRLAIRSVDTSAFPEVRISALSLGRPPALSDFTLRENGRLVPSFRLAPVEVSGGVNVVLTVDVSGSMNRDDAIARARQAAREFVVHRRPGDRIAVVAFNTTPRLVVDFTRDEAELLAAVDSLEAEGLTALWDAIILASGLFTEEAEEQRYLVVLSDVDADSFDNASQASGDEAAAAAIDAAATVFTIGLPSGPVDERELSEVAAATGGLHQTTTDPAALGGLYRTIQESLQNQYEIRYTSQAQGGSLEVRLAAQGSSAVASAPIPACEAELRFVDDEGGLPVVPLAIAGVVALLIALVLAMSRRSA
jgi:VWFA-related protein